MQWLGLKDYVEAMQLQDKIIDRCQLINSIVASDRYGEGHSFKEEILGLEHPLTVTLGKRADPIKDFRVSVKVLRDKKVNIVSVDRGGQATLHNPGQLVIYPIIHLKQRGLRIKDYVHLLEDVTKRFLIDHGISAKCKGDSPGLYTLDGKIAFFGIRIKRGMTSHGLAINVSNDLSEFAMIRSCGMDGETFSRMQDFGVSISLEELFIKWCQYFQTGLGLTLDANRPIVEASLDLRV